MNKKLTGILTGLIMVLTLAACGGSGAETAVSKDYVYRAEEVKLSGIEDMSTISDFYIRNGRMNFSCFNWEEESQSMTFISQNMDGSDVRSIELKLEDNVSYSYMAMDEDGNCYGICNEYFEDDSDPANPVWIDNYYLVKLDGQGKEIWKQELGSGEENYWMKWMKLLPDGRIVLQDTVGLAVYDKDGNSVKKLKIEDDNSGSAYLMQDGTVAVEFYNSETNENSIKKLNVDTLEYSEEYVIPGGAFNNYSVYPGAGYDFLMIGNEGVFGWNLGDAEMKQLMNFIDSDLYTNYIYNVSAINEKEFYGMTSDEMTGAAVLMKFTKVDPKDVADKKIMTLACSGLDWEVRKQTVRFNKTNPDYRIRIEDYSQYNTDDDYSAGTKKLNTDIASGKTPDILLLNQEIPIESYAAKGLFEDLYPYMDKDEEINRENFFPNILAAYETNGKLYRMIPRFTIYTIAGKTADVGTESGWTLEELNQVMASKPEGTMVFSDATQKYMLEYSISMSGEQFINWESGACSFNSPEFIELLEFIKQFPEQLSDDYYNDEYFRDYDTFWREGKVLLNMTYLDSFSSYNYMKKGTFGEDITLIGFPTADRNGSAIMANLDMVMSSKSKYKDGAWQFMRYFLSDEYQKTIDYGWPLNMKMIDALAEEAKKKPTYEDENGNIVEYEPTYTVGGIEVPITPCTQEEIDEVLGYIKSVNQIYTYNVDLINIVSEEAAPYFAGQKNAKEVADIIQSRAQIYVNENR